MKVLIVKTSSLGDIIHVFPAIAYLKTAYPEAEIHWVVEKDFRGLVDAHPDIDRVIAVDTRQWRREPLSSATFKEIFRFRQELRTDRYDLLFDMQGNSKSALVTFLARAKTKVGFGRLTVAEWPNMLATRVRCNPPSGQNIREDYLFLLQSYFKDPSAFQAPNVRLKISEEEMRQLELLLSGGLSKKSILVCSGSAWNNKQLDPQTLLELLQLMAARQDVYFLLGWGSEAEKSEAENLHRHLAGCSRVMPKLSLPMLQNLMGAVKLVMTMDSLPLHLAGTTETPTFSVFGPSLAEKYKPLGNQHLSFQGGCPYGRTFEKRCPILRSCPTGSCIKSLKAEELYHVLESRFLLTHDFD